MTDTSFEELDDDELLAQCRVDTFRAGGPGGQHQNTTESGVRLTHEPTGIVVTARDSRSQHRNRQAAVGRLRERLARESERDAPRLPTKRPRRAREARLSDKRKTAEKKRFRKPPSSDDA